MTTTFVRLNHDWNADPNAPEPEVARQAEDLILTFAVNASAFRQFAEGTRVKVVFHNCWRYRLGPTNDEGWYMGQCRFSSMAPAWGEFYQVNGDLHIGEARDEWFTLHEPYPQSQHYLFYLKDGTFECDSISFEVSLPLQAISA